MATTTITSPSGLQLPALNDKVPNTVIVQPSTGPEIKTINDLLVNRAETSPTLPLVAYPEEGSKASCIHYTAADLHRFTDACVKYFVQQGLDLENKNEPYTEVVALLAPSNLAYIVSIFALSRMGFSVLLLSNRLSVEAYVSLLQKTTCHRIVFSAGNSKSVTGISSVYGIDTYRIPTAESYGSFQSNDTTEPSQYPTFGHLSVSHRTAFIIHSSGSTGLPKPIFQTHEACLSNYSIGTGYRAFLTLPLYHNHGLSTFFRAIYTRNEISLFNANLPLSESNLVEAMESVQPQSFHGVPYALKLLGESERGVGALRKCKLVLFGGSSCPDDLGDRLVEAGVFLVAHYGATEIGQLMTSSRPAWDKAWNYVRPLPAVQPYIEMAPRFPGVYECIVLDGLPTKVISNSSDPANSFHTSDTFSPHPTIPNAWKYLGRLDDRVTLVNGEKVLPIPYEHQIRENPLVKDVCVFGIGRAFPGLIIIPSEKTRGIEKSELLKDLSPVIQVANSRVEGFGQISLEMVEILDIDCQYPQTDKGTLIRAAFYTKFADLIDSIYKRFETQDAGLGGPQLQNLSLKDLRNFLLEIFSRQLGTESLESTTDLFEAGLDSLQAIAARAQIMRQIDLKGYSLGSNVVFEYATVENLAKHLLSIQEGNDIKQVDELQIMRNLIEKYSHFSERQPGSTTPSKETILLTGTTGSLGAHILSQLINNDKVEKLYCLVRASSPENAHQRVESTFRGKGLDPSLLTSKVVCLPSDLSRTDLGLEPAVLNNLRSNLTCVIHSAWAVNFNLSVQSFESHHIGGLHNLISLCLSTATVEAARLYFCSSISAAAGTPIPAVIQETYVSDPAHAQNMGYARSKFVAEHIIKSAVQQTSINAKVLRVGQIVGDTENGIWNPMEAIPLMIRSATTIGALPSLQETPAWLPVNEVARAAIDLAEINGPPQIEANQSIVYHLQNGRTFHWTSELLPALREAGLCFETVPQREWVKRLREGEQDPQKNPTVKLTDFFAEKYDNDAPGRDGLVFETKQTGMHTSVVKDGFDIIGSGLVTEMVRAWRTMW